MSYIITEDCAACAVCESECPNQAISEGGDVYVINAERCTECVGFHDEPQCASVCPVDACVPDPDRRESRDDLMAKKKKLHGE